MVIFYFGIKKQPFCIQSSGKFKYNINQKLSFMA